MASKEGIFIIIIRNDTSRSKWLRHFDKLGDWARRGDSMLLMRSGENVEQPHFPPLLKNKPNGLLVRKSLLKTTIRSFYEEYNAGSKNLTTRRIKEIKSCAWSLSLGDFPLKCFAKVLNFLNCLNGLNPFAFKRKVYEPSVPCSK